MDYSYSMHIDPTGSTTSGGTAPKLFDVLYKVSTDIDGKIDVSIEYEGSSNKEGYLYRLDFVFNVSESDVGDADSWDEVIKRVETELDRHPFFDEYEHDML